MSWPFLAGEKPQAEKLGAGPNTYTPSLTAVTTNPNLGADGDAAGWWVRVGPRFVKGGAGFVLDGSGASSGSGILEIDLPIPADTSIMGASTTIPVIGSGWARSSTGSGTRLVAVILNDATTVRLRENASNSTVAQPSAGGWTHITIEFGYIPVLGAPAP